MATARPTAKAKPAAEKQPAQPLMRVRFARPHRHAGKDYAAGAEIDVDAATFELLEHFHAIEKGAAG